MLNPEFQINRSISAKQLAAGLILSVVTVLPNCAGNNFDAVSDHASTTTQGDLIPNAIIESPENTDNSEVSNFLENIIYPSLSSLFNQVNLLEGNDSNRLNIERDDYIYQKISVRGTERDFDLSVMRQKGTGELIDFYLLYVIPGENLPPEDRAEITNENPNGDVYLNEIGVTRLSSSGAFIIDSGIDGDKYTSDEYSDPSYIIDPKTALHDGLIVLNSFMKRYPAPLTGQSN